MIETKSFVVASALAWSMSFFDFYIGTFTLAVIATITRCIVTQDELNFITVTKFLIMSLFIALITKHLCEWRKFDSDLTISIVAFCTYTSREILDIFLVVPAKVTEKGLKRLFNEK